MSGAASCESLVDAYVTWLRQRFSVSGAGDLCEISTPFVDRHNDHVEVYVLRRPDGKLLLSDGGDTIRDLQMGGVDLSTPARQRMLETILASRGVKRDGDALVVESAEGDFPRRKHTLVQAILATGDLYVTARERVRGLFRDDVRAFLLEHEIPSVASVKIPGKSGYDHYADFVIPAHGDAPEKVLQAMASPGKQAAALLIFMWQDIQDYRDSPTSAYAMLNDEEGEPGDAASALSTYGVSPLRWSRRDEAAAALAS